MHVQVGDIVSHKTKLLTSRSSTATCSWQCDVENTMYRYAIFVGILRFVALVKKWISVRI